jgi:hypothetical protein
MIPRRREPGLVRIYVISGLAQTAYIGSKEEAITYSSSALHTGRVEIAFPKQSAARVRLIVGDWYITRHGIACAVRRPRIEAAR